MPDTGGLLFIAAGAILLGVVFFEWTLRRKKKVKPVYSFLLLFITVILGSCNAGPEPLHIGKDNCYVCKMTISDPRYAAEAITPKGKVYKFDDVHCLLSFINTAGIDKKPLNIYLVDFAGHHEFIQVNKTLLLKGGQIHAPMNGDVIAFSDKDSMHIASVQLQASSVNWEHLLK